MAERRTCIFPKLSQCSCLATSPLPRRVTLSSCPLLKLHSMVLQASSNRSETPTLQFVSGDLKHNIFSHGSLQLPLTKFFWHLSYPDFSGKDITDALWLYHTAQHDLLAVIHPCPIAKEHVIWTRRKIYQLSTFYGQDTSMLEPGGLQRAWYLASNLSGLAPMSADISSPVLCG